MRQMLHFAFGQSGKAFRIDLERCKDTVLTTRWESDPRRLTRTSPCRGYGRGLEEAITESTAGRNSVTSHHRVISRSLGNLRLIIQYQADACDCQCELPASNNESTASDDDLVIRADNYCEANADEDTALAVLRAGMQHSSACMVEIKSRDMKNIYTDDTMAQMWLSGQTRLYLARHVRGAFSKEAVDYRRFDAEIVQWQSRNAGKIGGFVRLLREIWSTVRRLPDAATGEKYALIYEPDKSGDHLKLVRRQTGHNFMRDATTHRLWAH